MGIQSPGPFLKLFSLLFFCSKKQCFKNFHFSTILAIFIDFCSEIGRFSCILGPPWWSFLIIFLDFMFWSFFSTFLGKNSKSEKSKNCSKHCKTHTIVKVAAFKKKSEGQSKHVEKTHRILVILVKNWTKIEAKIKKNGALHKNYINIVLWGALFAKRRFLNDFWASAGSRNGL